MIIGETEQQRKERERQEDLQRLRGFRPIDDDFMRCLFKDNIPLVELVLRIIIGKQDLIITDCHTQKDMKRLAGARSICLDAYGTDSENRKYDCEIQRADKGADPHRARYHSSVLDIENLDAGQEFKELPDTYTIFITEEDFYGKGDPVYVIERMNMRNETIDRVVLQTIKNLMETMKWSAEQAMAAMKISEADKLKYIAKL